MLAGQDCYRDEDGARFSGPLLKHRHYTNFAVSALCSIKDVRKPKQNAPRMLFLGF